MLPFRPLHSVQEAEVWANRAYPWVKFKFKGFHIDCINPTLRQCSKLFKRYENAASTISEIGHVKSNFVFNGEIAASLTNPQRIMLNPNYYGDCDGFKSKFSTLVHHRYYAGTNDIACCFTHEFAHHIYYTLGVLAESGLACEHKSKLMDTLWPTPDMPEFFTDPSVFAWSELKDEEWWRKEFPRWRYYAEKVSKYACTDPVEAWCESFVEINHNHRSKWSPYSVRLNEHFEELLSWNDFKPLLKDALKRCK